MPDAMPPVIPLSAAGGAKPVPRSWGHPAIDDDHRQLSGLMERFEESARSLNLPLSMILFESLLTAVQAHFKREENLLRSLDRLHFDDHLRLHEDVMRQLLSVRADGFMLLRCWPERATDLTRAMLHRSFTHDLGLHNQFVLCHNGDETLPPLTIAGPQ